MNLMTRNEEGIVHTESDLGTVTAQIPKNRSALGMIATNGLINGADYKEDSWVYFDGQRIRKWHVMFQGIRVWEPKFSDLNYLYDLYKRTAAANIKAWNAIQAVIQKIWETRAKGATEAIAHARPSHSFEWPEWKKEKPWWVYNIHNDRGYGLSFGFDWLDEKPKKLVNHELGEELYRLENRWYRNTCRRSGKVRTIFFEAMLRSLPKVNEDRVICLKFGEDTFWFYTKNHGPNCYWWEMFGDRYKFEVKEML
jgi:hypothetical protein